MVLKDCGSDFDVKRGVRLFGIVDYLLLNSMHTCRDLFGGKDENKYYGSLRYTRLPSQQEATREILQFHIPRKL